MAVVVCWDMLPSSQGSFRWENPFPPLCAVLSTSLPGWELLGGVSSPTAQGSIPLSPWLQPCAPCPCCVRVPVPPVSPAAAAPLCVAVRSHACEPDQFGKPGGCSDICLLGNSHKSRTCRCRSGFSLGSDGKSCKSECWLSWGNLWGEGLQPWALRSLLGPHNSPSGTCHPRGAAGHHGCPRLSTEPEHELFLVYGKGRPGIIRGMDMGAKVPDEHMIPIENLMNPRALDFHAETGFIYFADTTSYLIGRQKIDGTERETILKDGEWPRGLALPEG